MRISDFRLGALGVCVAISILAGCGGSQPPIGGGGRGGTDPFFAVNPAASQFQDAANALPAHIEPRGSSAVISDVQVSGSPHNYTLKVRGFGFGLWPKNLPKLPYKGDTHYFRIGDGTIESGFLTNAYPLDYALWTRGRIYVNDYTVASPSDCIEVVAWNPTTHAGGAWAGNIQPIAQGTPQIGSVQFAGWGKNFHMVVLGSGFGKAPVPMPYRGNTAFFNFVDFRYHPFAFNNASSLWGAGGGSDPVTLVYHSWTNTRIEIDGFAGAYGSGHGRTRTVVEQNDPVIISVWNTTNDLPTAWGGNIH